MSSTVDHEQPEYWQSCSLPRSELPHGLQDVAVEERHDDALQGTHTAGVISEIIRNPGSAQISYSFNLLASQR